MLRSQKDFIPDEKMSSAFLSEVGSVNRNLNLLCSRLDRLIMLLAIFAGSDLLLGNDLTGRIQGGRQQSQPQPQPQAQKTFIEKSHDQPKDAPTP